MTAAVELFNFGAPVSARDRPHGDDGLYGHDYAAPDKDALPVATLERWLDEVRMQPNWRLECDKDADYYDGHQLTSDMLERMRRLGFPTIKENLCRPTIDAVLGLEAKTRTDLMVKQDADEWEEVSMALSAKLKEAERESRLDKACSDAYAGQIKVGLHWVEVSRDVVPNRYPYRVRPVHRREIAWDWRFKDPDASDMRYLIRRQWHDEDVLCAIFPSKAKLIKQITSGWTAWWDTVIASQNTDLASSWENERASTIEQYEYRDYLRRRLCLYEIWYRTWQALPMLHLPDGRWVEYDRKNKEHVAAVGVGLLIPQIVPVPKVRLSFWIGPHRIVDIPSPYAHGHFPYVPFWGYREDRSGAPYGLIRNMRDQQDEINARKAKMMWLLSSKQVIVDNDAVKDHKIARQEIGRADAYIILNENRRPNSKFEVNQNLELSDQQFKVYENSKKALQDVAGVYQALLGKSGAADSGVAINSLIEQGTTTLAEINDNYRFGRRLVGELLLELVKEDVANGTTVAVGEGPQRREVTLNQVTTDEYGPKLANDVRRAGVKVVLDDVPSTPTYRAQQFAQLTELTKSLPPEIQAMVIDFVIEATDLPQRRAIAERIRQRMGIQSNVKPRNDEERQAQQAQAAEQQRKAALMARAEEADVSKKEADAEKTRAEAQKAMAELEQADPEVARQVEDQIGRIVAEAQAEIQQLNEKIKALEDALTKQTDGEMKAGVDLEKARMEHDVNSRVAELEGERNKIIDGLNKRIDQMAIRMKEVAMKARQSSAKKPASEKAKA